MKGSFLTAAIILSTLFNQVKAQHSANANYGENNYQVSRVNTIKTTTSSQDEMTIVIKGIYNEKSSSQIATFSVLQLGKTAEETSNLMDERINNVLEELNGFSKEVEIVTDLISFVPTYHYGVEKKLFNPKTYNEKPSGFELRKNIIIKYKKNNDLDKIIGLCAKNEIYDLVKVEYLSLQLDAVKDQMQKKALEQYKAHIVTYSAIMNTDLSKKEKTLDEGFNVVYPMESYNNYQAYSQANPNFSQKSEVNAIEKSITQYYNAALIKEHSFVINAEIIEPAIQVFYELTIRIKLKEDQLPKNTILRNNKYYIVTPVGEVKLLNL